MRIHSFKPVIALALASVASLPAAAAPAAAPDVTTGADTKQLQFDWQIVPQSNYYELWFKANDGAPYVKFSESRPWQPHASSSVSAHLLDWDQARYQVKACNPSGCSASPPIAVGDFMADTIGYFKAARLHNNGRFGIATAISEDGKTMAAFTAGETAPDFPKAAVYVFARIDGQWRQQARLIPESGIAGFSNTGLRSNSRPTLSLSADGNVLAAGMAFRNSNGVDSAGVTVYRRAGTQWTQEFQKIAVQFYANYVGAFFAEMDEAGTHIIFRGGGTDPTVIMLVRGPSGWTSQPLQQPPSDWRENGYSCRSRLSGDGQSIAWACARFLQLQSKMLFVSRPPNWQLTDSVPIPFPDGQSISNVAIDYAGKTIAVSSAAVTTPVDDDRNQVRVFTAIPNAANQWNVAAPIRAGTWDSSYEKLFASELALSRDGALLAIFDPRDTGQGTGALSPPLQPGTVSTGATYIYELRAQGPRLRRVLKPNNPIPEGGLFDGQVDFANNGKTLVVSEPDEPGNSSGIDGNRNAVGRVRTGAVWLY